MAVSRHEVHRVHAPVARSMHQTIAVATEGRMRHGVYATTAMLALLALYVLMTHVVSWGRVTVDDIRYGRPRTFHMTAQVGPGEQPGTHTHFVAMNLDRQVVVLEIPGGDVSQTRTLMGPYLFGTGEDLTPVTLHMDDVNRDGVRDLVLQVKDEEVIYLYRDGGFSLITSGERQQLMTLRGST